MEKHFCTDMEEKTFVCEVCCKGFSENRYLKNHLRSHKKKNSFICEICSKEFVRNTDLLRHLRIHTNEKPFICEVCSKEFSRNDELKRHLRTHTEKKPLICEGCCKGFSQKSYLRDLLIQDSGGGRFNCKVCSKGRANEKPFVCEICSKRFSRFTDLKRHLRIHTNEKPFICEICSKEFSRNDELKRHLRTHSEEKPFISEISFTRQLLPEKDTDQSSMPSLESVSKVPKKGKRPEWDLKGRVQDMEDNLFVTQEQNEYLKHELDACNMRISSLESVNSLLHHDNEIKAVISEEAIMQIDELEAQLKKKTEETERLQKEICFLKQEISNGKKEFENLKKMYEQETGFMKSTITNLTFLKSSIEAQLDATKLMLFTHETEINQLKIKCSEKDTEIKSLKEHNAEIESKLRQEESLRRKLHNTIQELKGNIRVFCRMRPALSEEIKHGMNLLNVVAVTDKTIEIQHVTDMGLTESAGKMHLKYEFSFDCYFPPYTSQEKVFSEISQLVQSALDGYNVCIFAYGQTGSGKTYTMEGPADILDFVANHPKLGMIPRSVSQIFSTIEELHLKGWKYRVEALFLEIYNERIRDLLNSQGGNSRCDILKSGNRGTDCVLSNVTTSEVTSCEQVYELMRKARMNRAVAATKCNEYSSRSHYVFQMKIYGENSVTGEKCESTLNLVDLAGSERLKDSESVGERLNEAKAINKSLSNLGKVIMSLSRKESYVAYRDSKLTHLLANSLGGNCKTLMFVNISPDNKNLCETLNSLRFATKVNKCDIGTAHKRIK